MPKRNRPVQLGPTQTLVERDARGGYLLRAATPLGAYPRHLTERLVHWAKHAPDRTFLAKRGADGAWISLSYGEALARVRRLAASLLSRELSAARPLMILSENDVENALLALAAQHVGIPYVPVSPAYSLMSRDYGRLKQVVEHMTPGLVFVSNPARYGRAVEAAIDPRVEVVSTIEAARSSERVYTPFAALEQRKGDRRVDYAHEQVGPDSIAKFLLTSGSTGTPKATIQTARMLASNAQMIAQLLPFLQEEPPVIVDWLPWHHVFGGSHNFNIVLYNGGTLYIDEGKPTPELFNITLRNLREISPTVYFNVPRGFDDLVIAFDRDEALARAFFKRVKLMFYAAASLSQKTWDALERIAERSCGERIVMITGLGMTETSPWAMSAHWPDGQAGEVGVPAPGVEVRLTPVGHKLEARYRGPSVTPGFWRDEELTKKSFDEDGFYRSGDAVAFTHPHEPARGLRFDGRLAEDFKLDTGTWVSVGPLRANVLREGAPYVQDIVPTAPNRSQLGVLIVPNVQACRKLCPALGADGTAEQVLAHPATRAWFQELIDRLAKTAGGSSERIVRALVMSDALSLDAGEVTDKGTVVQSMVRVTRAALIDKVYSDDPEVLTVRET